MRAAFHFVSIVFFVLIRGIEVLYAQKIASTTISFDYYVHDFGSIKEEGGPVTYEFKFQNAGNAPLYIKNITASCGCTVPTWSKDPIPPGEQGYVKVQFDPKDKPGPFNKTLTVESNSYNSPVILSVQGKVLPKPRKTEDQYPDKLGSLRMLSRYMNLGDIYTHQWQRKTFELYNHSDSTVLIKNITVAGSHISVSIDPTQILPKSKAKITLDYSPKWKNDFGHVQDRILLETNDSKEPIKTVFGIAYIKMSFDDYTPQQIEEAPVAELERISHDFGNISPNTTVQASFNLTNKGKSNLSILKIKPSCSCTWVENNKKDLKPGESTSITIVFDPKGKEGVQVKHINIFTNDPKNHNIVLTVRSKITKLKK